VSAEGGLTRYGANQAYVRAIQRAGADVVLIPPACDGEAAARTLDALDGLLLPGGADVHPRFYNETPSAGLERTDPERDETEIAVVRAAVGRGLPVLGICRGQQLINVALGGTLYQDIATERAASAPHQTSTELGRDVLAHTIEIEPGSWLAETVGSRTLEVNSLHHQAVKNVAAVLRVTALSPDGMVEGVETPDRRVVAVQCHPEEFPEQAWARDIFRSFVEVARL
jgi:putative glutamine amidotransferase